MLEFKRSPSRVKACLVSFRLVAAVGAQYKHGDD